MTTIPASKAAKQNKLLEPLQVLIGEWSTAGSHPFFPGEELKGHAIFKWIEGGAFLQMKTHVGHPRFPDGIAILGTDDGRQELTMIYFDERGVSRVYSCTFNNNKWTWQRDDPEFSQQFQFEIATDGNTIVSTGKMSRNGKEWETDLELTYSRIKS